MGKIVGRIRVLALAWGAPGLFLVAFLDSSVLPLPGITDLLLVVMVTNRPERVVWYVVATTAGSVAGCLIMHFLGRKGGEALVRRRFAGPRVERARTSLKKHGVFTVVLSSLLPPPSPFKLFLLLAGAVGIGAPRFAFAIAIGRGARYLALGLLAVRYGARALTYVRENGTAASLGAVGVLVAGFGVYLWWSKARGRKNR
jgi:membrane protein YqaA with SNARE-associated domain